MNKIYKVIWSKTRNCYVAVAEFVKRSGKGSSLNCRHIAAALGSKTAASLLTGQTVAAALLAASVVCGVPGMAMANSGGTLQANGDYIGDAPDYTVTIDENVGNNAYGRHETSASASDASITVASGTIMTDVYGGYSAAGPSLGNTVTISGGTVTGTVYGGRGAGRTDSNTVRIEGGTVESDVFGGFGNWMTDENTVTISDGIVKGKVYGGRGREGAEYNTVRIEGGTIENDVFGGTIGSGTVTDNGVEISGGKVKGEVYGGKSGEGSATSNTVTISGGTVGDGTRVPGAFGSSANTNIYGGRGSYAASWNTVRIKGGTVLADVFGGFAYSGDVTGNRVEISGGTIGDANHSMNIYGGILSSNRLGSVTGNTVILSGGKVKGEVYGGRDFGGDGTVSGNKIILRKEAGKNAPNLDNAILYGGFGGSVSDNTLQVEAAGLSARAIYDFDNYKFVLPSDIKAGDTMLQLTGQDAGLEIDGSKVGVSLTKGTLADIGLNLGESVTLLEKTGGSGSFAVTNPQQLPKLEDKLDGVGFTTMVGKTEPVGGENKIRLTVSEKYLYGDGGTNTPGQRQTGNTLEIKGGKANVAFGGRATSGDVTGNKVTMSGGEIVEGSSGGSSFNPYTGNLYGGLAVDGVAAGNEVTISGGTLGRFTYVFGGRSEQGAAGGTDPKDGNKVTITGGTVGTVQGGYSLGDASYNSVEIAGGTVLGDAYGGESSQGNALNNSVTVKNGTVQGDAYGGQSTQGNALNNNVTVKNGTVQGDAYGGYTKLTGMKAAGNKVTITGGVVQNVYGGWVEDTNENGDSVSGSPNPASATENTVEIRGGTVKYNVYGGRSLLGPAERNTVKISDGTVGRNVNGGYSIYGAATSNSVEITGGKVEKLVFGGESEEGNATSNTVTISGGTVTGWVFGGYARGSATGNTVILSKTDDAAPVINGMLYGGFSRGGDSVLNNTLQVEAVGLSVPEIIYFDTYKFVLPADSKAGDTMLQLTAQNAGLTIDGSTVGVSLAKGTLADIGLGLDESVTLLAKTGGSGAFTVDNTEQMPKLEDKLDGVDSGFTTLVGKVQKPGGEDRLDFTVSEKYLYGEGGTNPVKGERQTGNTLNITDGVKATAAFGGRATTGDVTGNIITMTGGEIVRGSTSGPYAGNLYGGRAVDGNVAGNEVTVSGGTLGRFTYVYGGRSEQGAAGGTDPKDGNKVTITGGTVGAVQGGYSLGDASYNSVEIAGGTVLGDAYGGESSQGNALNNSVTVKEGTVNSRVYGGYTYLTGKKASGNKVTITGGTVNDTVTGGTVYDYNEDGSYSSNPSNPASATENTVEIRGGIVNSFVTGGFSDFGPAERNTVILAKEEGKDAPSINGTLYGGRSASGSVVDNTLQVEAVGLSAPRIQNFDNYKFVLPSDIKAGDTMLKLTGQDTNLTINADYVNVAMTMANADLPGKALLGESITLLEKAGGNGTFGVDGLKTGGEGIYPIWLDGQEGLEQADYSLVADRTKLEMRLEGLYLYGEGGINPTLGQRKSNNTLTVSAGTKATAAFGGRVNIGDVTGNKVTMSGGELVTTDVTHPNYGLSGNVYGGLAEDGAATGNRVTLDGGKLRAAYGGFTFAGTAGGEGEGLGNSVAVRGGQVAEGVYGGYAVQKDAVANLVAVSGGTVSGDVVGGYTEQGHTIKNVVTVEDKGNINGNVTAGQSEKGEVRANTITAKGGLVAGSLFGGRSESGEVRDNTLMVSGGIVEGNLTAGQSGSGEVRANTLTVEGGEIKGRLTLGQVSGTLTGGLSSKGGSVKNAVTLSGGIFTGAVSVTGGSSPVKAADNVVNLTGTTTGLEGATLRGYSDAKAAHSGNELHVGGVKEYDASGNATITKATWQGIASASNGTGTLLRTAALRNTAGASGGTAQQGVAGSGTNGNRVDTVANFDSIALHNVVWGDTPALSAKTIENIGGLDVTGLEFFTHPDNSTVHEHALQDSMVLLRADNNELTGMQITYLDEGNVKTEALTGQGINYHKADHHSEENGVTVDGSEVKRIYLADHNKSVDFLYHVDGTKIALGNVEFVKDGTARILDRRFDVRNAAIDANSLPMTEASLEKAAAGDTMTVLDAEDAIKTTGETATLKEFTGEGVTGGVKQYDVKFTDALQGDGAGNSNATMALSGIHTDTLAQNAERTKLAYTVGEKKVREVTLAGAIDWNSGGVTGWSDGVTAYADRDYQFNTDAKIDMKGLSINRAAVDPQGQSMTLVSGKAAGTVENAPASFGVSLAGANTTLDATAKGAASVANGDVTYAVTGVTLDKVTVNQVTAGTDSVPKGWAIASGLEIDTDTMQLPTGTANSKHAILTAGSGSFAGANVTGQYAYASHSPFTLKNGGVAVAGEKEGGVKLSDDNKSVEYHVVQDRVKNVALGPVEFAKDKTLLTVGGEYEFTKVNAINTTDFAMNYVKPETVAANDSMTLLQGNSTLQANALLANMAADVKTKNYSYSFEPVAGVNVAAKITGSLGTTAKGDGFTYTVNEHRADKLTFGSVEWKHSGALLARPDNIIFAGAAVDTTKIHFHNVDSLKTDHHMTLVSDFGDTVGQKTGDHYTVGSTLQGKGRASLKGSDLVYTIEHGTHQDTPTPDPTPDPNFEAQPQTHNTVMGMTAGISLLASGAEQISQAMAGLNLMDSFGGMNTAGGAATGTTGAGGTGSPGQSSGAAGAGSGSDSGTAGGDNGASQGSSEASGQGQDGTGSENTGSENNGSDPAKGEEGQKDENGQGSGKGSGGRDDEQKETDAEGIIIASIGGSKDRVETGSHVTSHNWNGVLGIGGKRMMKSGTLQYAAFAEHGRSNFTLHSENGRGSGNSRYTGGGLIAKWQNRHNVYMEASIRAGRMHDTASNMLHDPLTGQGYGYDVRANYIGGHVGVGKVYYYENGRSLDVYGRFFHMKRDGVSFDAGGHFDLDSVKSSVLRVGARYGATDKLWNWYGGLAYEYEFDGKSTGTADGAPIRSASMSGGSVRGEIGLRMNSSKTNPWKADISLTAHAGKHRGFGGNVSVAYTF